MPVSSENPDRMIPIAPLELGRAGGMLFIAMGIEAVELQVDATKTTQRIHISAHMLMPRG